MTDASAIREHMDVIGADGVHVGTVDAVEGDRIKLTKADSDDGRHHFIPTDWVDHIDEHGDLADTRAKRLVAAEDAIDAVRAKFGKAAVRKGIVFRP